MVSRKRRVRVVLDTNVIVGAFLSRNSDSANVAAVELWYILRRIEVVVCHEIVREYLGVLQRVNVSDRVIEQLERWISARETVTWVNLGPRVVASRDPDDDIFLSTAKAGRASYLVTNDRDLLELDDSARKRLRFEIVTPQSLISKLASR